MSGYLYDFGVYYIVSEDFGIFLGVESAFSASKIFFCFHLEPAVPYLLVAFLEGWPLIWLDRKVHTKMYKVYVCCV